MNAEQHYTNQDKLEIKPVKITATPKPFILNVADFGKHTICYPTHELLMAMVGIYVITFNMKEVSTADIEYWIQQIPSHSDQSLPWSKSTIILVGTHSDLCSEDEIESTTRFLQEKFPKRRFRIFDGDIIMVNNKTGNMKALTSVIYNHIEKINSQNQVSPSWIFFHKLIKSITKSTNMQYCLYDSFLSWAQDCDIPVHEIPALTNFLISTGLLIHFAESEKESSKNDLYIFHPSWIVDLISTLQAMKGSLIGKDGFIECIDIRKLFAKYPPELHGILMKLFKKFNIILPMFNGEKFLVPSVLQQVRPSIDISSIFSLVNHEADGSSILTRVIELSQVPVGLFGRILISILHIPGCTGRLFWKNGLIVNLFFANKLPTIGQTTNSNPLLYVEYEMTNYQLFICLRFPSGERNPSVRLWRQVLEAIRVLFESYYPRLVDNLVEKIPCTHCINRGKSLHSSYLFTYHQCDESSRNGELYIYCNSIKSPTRKIELIQLAPDIGFQDMPHISENSLEISSMIGQGGFAKVSRGTINKKIDVAVKELIVNESDDNDTIKKKFQEFQTECYMMSLLSHPNIVDFYGIICKPPRIVLQLITGGDLQAILDRKDQPLPWKRRLEISLDIAKGLHYLKSITPPVIHRDLRAPNIFIDHNGKALIGDFGLARLVQGKIGGILATWQNVAPEILDHSQLIYDEISDIYSFAIIMWQLATYSNPYEEYASDPR